MRRMTTRVLILGIVLLSMVSCKGPVHEEGVEPVGVGSAELLTDPHYPHLREEGLVRDADLKGELALENGCLRVRNAGINYLLIWPRRLTLTVDGQDIRVIGESGDSGVSLSVGDEIRIGGGAVSLAGFQTEQPIPNECPGPYWVVGYVPTLCSLEGCNPP